jgi:hypothetical protein
MTPTRRAAPSRPGTRRAGLRRPTFLTCRLALAAAVLAAAAGCSSHAAPDSRASGDAASAVHDLGAVPIPSPPTAQATPTANEHHLQLVAMGDAVHVNLPGVQADIQASGPTEDLPAPATGSTRPPDHTAGTITLTVTQATAALTVHAGDLTSRDQQGQNVALTALGSATITAAPGHPATITLRGTFQAGAAELTWRHDRKTLAIWDFNIELD